MSNCLNKFPNLYISFYGSCDAIYVTANVFTLENLEKFASLLKLSFINGAFCFEISQG
jgi:hypothetical protein